MTAGTMRKTHKNEKKSDFLTKWSKCTFRCVGMLLVAYACVHLHWLWCDPDTCKAIVTSTFCLGWSAFANIGIDYCTHCGIWTCTVCGTFCHPYFCWTHIAIVLIADGTTWPLFQFEYVKLLFWLCLLFFRCWLPSCLLLDPKCWLHLWWL